MGFRKLFGRRSDREQFAKLIEDDLRAQGWPHPIRFDRERFILVLGPHHIYRLESVFQEHMKLPPEERNGVVKRIVRSLTRPAPKLAFDAVRSLLLPVVARRTELEGFRLDPPKEVEDRCDAWVGAFEPLCDALAIVAVIDDPDRMTFVDSKLLKELDRSLKAVLEQAIGNLRRVESHVAFIRHKDGFFISQYRDHYDNARLLVPEVFRGLPLRGAPVAIAVARDVVVAAGAEDNTSLSAMAAFALTGLQQATRPISCLPLILRNERWTVFRPNDPELEPLARLGLMQTMWDYRDQKAWINRYFEHIGRDVFVASLEATAGARPFTWTLWQDLPTLLPRAEVVRFPSKNGPPLSRHWEAVVAVCGEAMIPEDFYPPRFFAACRPSAEQMAILEEHFELPDWLQR